MRLTKTAVFSMLLAIVLSACAAQEETGAPGKTAGPTTAVDSDPSAGGDTTPSVPGADTTPTPPGDDGGDTTPAPAVEGPAAPDFDLTLSDGSSFSLSAEQKPVYLVFWAEW